MWICYNTDMTYTNEQPHTPERTEAYKAAQQLAALRAELLLQYYQTQDNTRRDEIAKKLLEAFNA